MTHAPDRSPTRLPSDTTVLAVFAHPDDECLVAGTLAQLSQTNTVIIACATRGERGKNPDQSARLMQLRARELRHSASLLGITKVHFLGFRDGRLCNASYQRLVTKLETILERYQPSMILTFEPRGVSGHLDHIALTSACHYWFDQKPYLTQMWQFGITPPMHATRHSGSRQHYFVYRPPGIPREQFDRVIDISAQLPTKIAAIKTHRSQQNDVSWMLTTVQNTPAEECFFVITKEEEKERR